MRARASHGIEKDASERKKEKREREREKENVFNGHISSPQTKLFLTLSNSREFTKKFSFCFCACLIWLMQTGIRPSGRCA